MCSSLLEAVLKQYSTPSSPRAYSQSPRGDTLQQTKAPPSFLPDWKLRTTCPCSVIRNTAGERLHTKTWSDFDGFGTTLLMATSRPEVDCGGLRGKTKSHDVQLSLFLAFHD